MRTPRYCIGEQISFSSLLLLLLPNKMGWGRRKLSGAAGGGNSVYNTAGQTLSEKNAIKEFRITSAQLDQGVEANKLSVQYRSCHGNSYRYTGL